MNNIPKSELEVAITDATRKAVMSLFENHNENFYYLSLITTGEALRPYLSAWSWEALKNESEDLKWSYADSPYCLYGDEFFQPVAELYSKRPSLHDDINEEWETEYNLRLDAMEAALAQLDKEGVFGEGEARNNIVINAEVMPPDFTNTERAKRLNPELAIKDWLIEAAE